MQLRNLRFFVCFRKLKKKSEGRRFVCVHLRFFAVLSLLNDIRRKRVADSTIFAKIAKNRKVDDFLRSLVFRVTSL